MKKSISLIIFMLLPVFLLCGCEKEQEIKEPDISASPITKYLCKRRCDRKGHTAFCYSYGYLFAFASAVQRDAIVLFNGRQINDTDSIVVNFNLLFSVSTALVGSVDYYFVNQII